MPLIVQNLVARAMASQIDVCDQPDSTTLEYIANPDLPRGARVPNVRKRLERYNVLQGFTHAKRDAVANALIDFASQPGNMSYANGVNDIQIIFKKYKELYAIFQGRLSSKQDVISLTSKALWFCFPHDVVLYDSFVQRSLWVLSKLLRLPPLAGDNDYEIYANTWFSIYNLPGVYAALNAGIAAYNLQHGTAYNYELRVFDKILWDIGRAEYV